MSHEPGTNENDKPMEETSDMSEIPLKDLHKGTLVLRFEENARTVAITWLPDDVEAEPFHEHRSLIEEEFDGECFAPCVEACVNAGNSLFLCIVKCAIECALES